MSLSSKRRFVWNTSHRKEKDPDLMRVSTRSPGIDGMPAKIPASEAGASAGGGLCGGRGGCGREEEDGREEGAAVPLETLRALLPVAGDDVALVLYRLLVTLSRKVSTEGRSQIESVWIEFIMNR